MILRKRKKDEKEVRKIDQQQIEIGRIKSGFRKVRILSFLIFLAAITLVVFPFISQQWGIKIRSFLGNFIPLAIPLSLIVMYITKAVKLVTEGERAGVLRLKKYYRTLKPGIEWIWYPLDKVVFADIREQEKDIPPQNVITEDNTSVTVDAVLNYEIIIETTPKREKDGLAKFLFDVTDPISMLTKQAQSFLRDWIAEHDFASARTGIAKDKSGKSSKGDTIDEIVKEKLNGFVKEWGIKINRFKLKEVNPSQDVQDAMNKRKIAEEEKVATITNAEATKKADILVSQGKAEGIENIYTAIKQHDPNFEIKSLETLVEMAKGDSVIFMEGRHSGLMPDLIGVAKFLKKDSFKEEPKKEKSEVVDKVEDEKSEFIVELISVGNQTIQVIQVVKEITGKELKETKDFIAGVPKVLKENVKKKDAEEMKAKLEAVGASVELK